jgi:hypothetical protein
VGSALSLAASANGLAWDELNIESDNISVANGSSFDASDRLNIVPQFAVLVEQSLTVLHSYAIHFGLLVLEKDSRDTTMNVLTVDNAGRDDEIGTVAMDSLGRVVGLLVRITDLANL